MVQCWRTAYQHRCIAPQTLSGHPDSLGAGMLYGGIGFPRVDCRYRVGLCGWPRVPRVAQSCICSLDVLAAFVPDECHLRVQSVAVFRPWFDVLGTHREMASDFLVTHFEAHVGLFRNGPD